VLEDISFAHLPSENEHRGCFRLRQLRITKRTTTETLQVPKSHASATDKLASALINSDFEEGKKDFLAAAGRFG